MKKIGLTPELEGLLKQITPSLERFVKDNPRPIGPGCEDEIRKFIFNEIHEIAALENLRNEDRILFNNTWYRPDLFFIGNPNGNGKSEELTYKDKPLTSLVEFGHDFGNKVNGCVNKPYSDFIKWHRLFEKEGRTGYKRIPILHFQVITNEEGLHTDSVNKIASIYQNTKTLVGSWEVKFPESSTTLSIFCNYFPKNHSLTKVFQGVLDEDLIDDLENYIHTKYKKGESWVLNRCEKESLKLLKHLINTAN